MVKKIKEIFEYKEMLISLVKRDLRARYKGSLLGYLWTLLMPFLQLLVYSLVFGSIFGNQIDDFPIFLFVALLPWNAFSMMLNTSTSSIVTNAPLVKKIYFPKVILPIQTVLTACIDQIFGTVILILGLLFYGIGFSWHIVLFPLIIICQIIFFIGFAMIFSSLFVKLRDLQYIVSFLVMMLFYLTPIIYDANMFTGFVSYIIKLNPLTSLIECYRCIFMYHQLPSLFSTLYLVVFTVIVVVVGYKIFFTNEKTFAEEI